mmetsp:Transcript_7071/g.17515  ORF Transcript_7071/g.17515 Transcript_7071/m.17515 type:complete len:588 (+) Transcript_7071:40-1803(+)
MCVEVWLGRLAFGFRRRILEMESQPHEVDRITLGKTLGSGTFGSVLIGHHPDPERGDVAVKRFGFCGLSGKQCTKIRISFENERNVLFEVDHPFIIHVFDAYVDNEAAYLILELCRGGDLYDFVVKSHSRQAGVKCGVTEEMAQVMLRQMALAVQYLHGRHIVHRDIKSENFVFLKPPFQESFHDWVLKLCDFGAASRLSESRPRCMANIGTLSYTAPEVYDQRGASFVADVWSIGVVLYVVLCGYSPFRPSGKESPEQAVGRIRQGNFERGRPSWQRLSAKAQDLICSMLVVDEDKRLSARAVLSHPFLAQSWELNPSNVLLDPISCSGPLLHALTYFSSLDGLQRLCWSACAWMLSEGEITRDAWSVFVFLDRDCDGRLSVPELFEGLLDLLHAPTSDVDDRSRRDLLRLVKDLDSDGSGFVEYSEFMAALLSSASYWMPRYNSLNLKSVFCRAFVLLDKRSGDGVLKLDDVKQFAGQDMIGCEKLRADVHVLDAVKQCLATWGSVEGLETDAFDNAMTSGLGCSWRADRHPSGVRGAYVERIAQPAGDNGVSPAFGHGFFLDVKEVSQCGVFGHEPDGSTLQVH